MATVHFTFTQAMDGIAPTLGGQPVGEAVSAGGTTTAVLGNRQVCRAVATSGASYVKLGGAAVTGASDGYYLAEGATIEMHGSAGDAASQVDA